MVGAVRLLMAFAWLRRFAGLVAALVAGAASPAPSAPTVSPAVLTGHLAHLSSLTRSVVESYVVKGGPRDPWYWKNGSFVAVGGQSCWSCYDTAATAAAVLSREGRGDVRMRNVAVGTFDHVIRTYQQSDGLFTDGVTTGFFTVELGISYLELKPYLDSETRSRWITSIRRAADALISSGDMTYYINGNVNLRQTEVMWLAWAATGQQRFRAAYEREWQFTIAPPTGRWGRYGLRYTQAATPGAGGSDGAGYLTESNGSTPGYDPSYTMAQLDSATELYVLTRNPRYLWLMNLLFNQDRPRVGGADILNATLGSRKNDMIPFLSAGPGILVASGARPDLLGFWLGQLGALHLQYKAALQYGGINFYKGTSAWLAVPLLAIEWPHGMLAAPCAAATSVPCARLF
jgi:hypothetical protein